MLSDSIRSLPTRYLGVEFRSRLEARWAVAFSEIGIEYVYEPEGYSLPCGKYLPDFWLPQVRMFAEVKPVEFDSGQLTKCAQLVEETRCECLLLFSQPSGPHLVHPAITAVEYNHGMWDVFLTHYDIFEGHGYWKNEARFYDDCTGEQWEAGCESHPVLPSGQQSLPAIVADAESHYWRQAVAAIKREKFGLR